MIPVCFPCDSRVIPVWFPCDSRVVPVALGNGWRRLDTAWERLETAEDSWNGPWQLPEALQSTLATAEIGFTRIRTRVARVRAEYPNQLDYSGVAV